QSSQPVVVSSSSDLQEINHFPLKADAVISVVAATSVEVAPCSSVLADNSTSPAWEMDSRLSDCEVRRSCLPSFHSSKAMSKSL
ncbi:hypothetical protein A2U01_0072005, partial [Trifolium medium]|nr:hypothetical protein [Trifolium medium]